MAVRGCIAATALLGVAGLAVAQSQHLVFTQDNDEPGGAGYDITATAPGVATSSLATVVTANRRIALYNRSTLAVEDFRSYTPLGSPPFPFVRVLHPEGPPFYYDTLFEPRATYDPINDRLWMLYTETQGNSLYLAECGPVAKLHLAVNRDPAHFPTPHDPLDSLDDDYWYYYTGDGTLTGKAGALLDLTDDNHVRYQGEDSQHFPPAQTVRGITMGFHHLPGEPDGLTGAAIVTPNQPQIACDSGGDLPYDRYLPHQQLMYIIPFQHDGGTKSILDGDRPDPNDITIIRLQSSPILPSNRKADPSDFAYAVQAPYEQANNASFYISVPDRATAEHLHKHVRLKGLFYDDNADAGKEWTLQQSVRGTSVPYDWDDMELPEELWFVQPIYSQSNEYLPETPDTLEWRPHAGDVAFQSAVLAKDVNGDMRIFAVHAVRDVEVDGEEVIPQDEWVVQWYVIDPDLGNFHDTPAPATSWEPGIAKYTVGVDEVDAMGRIDTDGHAYHPVIVVNRQGQAFIEFTYSDGTPTGWPQIRRVRLNSSYSDVVSGTNTLVRGGPELPYVPDSTHPTWALQSDAQADPFNGCAYWSTHTLVHDPGEPLPDDTKGRDVWLFHQAYTNSVGPLCFQTTSMLDLTDDGEVDAYDLAEFSHLYDRRARRVDINGDGVVDAIDMALYLDAYDAATGP